MKVFYLPLEPYIERYTYFMSCVDGWTEDNLKKDNVEFVRIDGETLNNNISVGFVLDAYGRSYYAMSQLCNLIKLIQKGDVKDGDLIYTEDFWHPGIESLFYIRSLTGIKFKIGTFCHAQSVDSSDFTYKMRDWMRHIERGFGKQYDYIMVTSAILKELLVTAEIGTDETVFNVGLPYNSKKLLQQLNELGFKKQKKEDFVLFSSRFDDEKDPNFFLDVVEACPEINFKLVKPRKILTKNKQVLDRLQTILDKPNSNLELVDTSNKLNYYTTLSKAKVQFNCAIQDWVSWTLLEAVTFECLPLYPIWKDFPVELKDNPKYLYSRKNLENCVTKLRYLMRKDVVFNKNELQYIVDKHDSSWHNYLINMNVLKKETD